MRRAISLLALLATPILASAASFSSNPTADAFVTTGPSGNLSANNYGGGGALSVSASGLSQGEFQSVLKFDASAAASSFDATFGAGQWVVESVTLRVNATPANNTIYNTPAAGQFGIAWMENDSWIEGSGSPNSPGATGITFDSLQDTFIGADDQSLGTFPFDGATSGSLSYGLGLTPGLTGDLLTGAHLSLRLFAADASLSAVFNSRNFGTAANRPLLTIVAIPEPGALELSMVGLLVLCGWQQTRRSMRRMLRRGCDR